MKEQKINVKIILLGPLIPVLLILLLDLTINEGMPKLTLETLNPRVANSALTSYTIVSLFLLGNMYFYGESRNRPLAPIFGMLLSVLIGILATSFFISMGPMLLENNGSVRAQMVYNIAHLIVSVYAISFSTIIGIGILFATITHSKSRITESKLYEQE